MKTSKIILLTAFGLLLVVAPLTIQNRYTIHLLIMVAVYILLTQGLNLLVGYMGLLSLGQQAYILVGGYVSALLAIKLGLSFWLTLPMAILFTIFTGLMIGYVTLRLRGAYFVIVTIGFAEIARLIPLNIDELGGPPGLRGIPTPSIHIGSLINFDFGYSKVPYYFLVWVLAILAVFIASRLVNSRQGRAFLAMRENEPLAQAVGINAFRYAMMAFAVSVSFTGAAGAFLAHYITHISPEIGAFHWTVAMLVMTVIGGQGTIVGPIIGAFIFTFLPEWLRLAEEFRLPIYGFILMLAVLFFPQGLHPVLVMFWDRILEKFAGKWKWLPVFAEKPQPAQQRTQSSERSTDSSEKE